MKRGYPLVLFACCSVVLGASFLLWGTTPYSTTAYIISPIGPAFGEGGPEWTGWTGSIVLFETIIPNRIVVAVAEALAFIGWLQAIDHSVGNSIKPIFSLCLAAYGAFHSLVYISGFLFLVGSPVAMPRVGVGAIATAIAFVAIAFTLEISIITRIRAKVATYWNGQRVN